MNWSLGDPMISVVTIMSFLSTGIPWCSYPTVVGRYNKMLGFPAGPTEDC